MTFQIFSEITLTGNSAFQMEKNFDFLYEIFDENLRDKENVDKAKHVIAKLCSLYLIYLCGASEF